MFTPYVKKIVVTIGVLSSISFLTACGNSNSSVRNLVTAVSAQSFQQAGDAWVSVSATLNTGGYTLAAIDLPLADPRNPAVQCGMLSLKPILCSSSNCAAGGTLSISVNLTEAIHLEMASTDLPNGTAFPLAFSSGTNLIAIPIGKNGAKVYLALGGGMVLVGAAIPFTALDGAGKYTPGLNVFDAVSFSNITTDIGIFAGSGTNQTGIGIFADLSKVVNRVPTPTMTPAPTTLAAQARMQAPAIAVHGSVPQVQILPTHHSSDEVQSLYYNLWKNKKRHSTLRLQ